MISKSSAPGKVILFGEHFVVHGVKAVLCAIDRRIFVTAETIDECKIIIESNVGYLKADRGEDVSSIDSTLRPLYFLAEQMLKEQSGIRLQVSSEIPPGIGLGSSSACCVAGAGAISGLTAHRTRAEILELAIEAERTIFQDTSGADCTVSAFGGIMEYSKSGFSKIESDPDFQLVIANSGMVHSTEKVVAGVQKFKKDNKERFAELCRQESDLVEDVLKMLKKDEVENLGKKAMKNQAMLEIMGVSNETLREMLKIGDSISYGSKITGAGDGGCIYALTDQDNAAKVLDEFKSSGYECFSAKIDFKGLDTL